MIRVTDTTASSGPHGADGLARTISGVGLTISQAADELQQAAERLIAAEEQAREADARVAAMEDQLAQGATKNAELLALMQAAREDYSEAEERAQKAEERSNITMERGRLLEERAHELEDRTRELEGQIAQLTAQLEETQTTKPGVTVILDDERTALQEAVAAEIRRPLTSILGITLALKHTDSKAPDGREMIRQLSTNARKLDRLVGEMLNIDRIAAGTYTPNLRRTDLEALVRRVIEESPELANRDVKVETDHVAIEVDPALTEHIVETLLANSGRRTVPGNEIRVRVSSDADGAIIAVDDAGADVPPGLRQTMFSPRREGQIGSQPPRGATGLSLLSRLTDIHGGRCWVEEAPGGGASFRVFLPGSPPSGADPSAETRERPAATPTVDDESEEPPEATNSASLREAGIGGDTLAI